MAHVLGKIKPGVMEWSKDFTAERQDDKGKFVGSWTYDCHIDDIFRFMPATGAPCVKPGWEFLKVSGLDVESIQGKVASIKVKFNGFPEGDDFGFGDESINGYTIDESTSSVEEPISTHPQFDGIGAEKYILKRYKNGELIRDLDNIYNFYPAELVDGKLADSVKVESDAGKKLLEYIDNGVEKYLKPQIRRTISWSSDTKPTTTNEIGKIGTPTQGGDKPPGIVNWLLLGFTVSYSNKVWTATEEWLGGDWDDYLYEATPAP